MSDGIGQLLAAYQSALWHGFLIFLRVGGVMMVLPAFGEQTVPLRIKLGLSFVFTIVVAASVPVWSTHETAISMLDLARYVVTEPVIGLAMGLGFRMFLLVLQTAGVIAAQSLSLSQILGGAGADPMPALGQVLVIAGLALAVMAGLHIQASRAMILSYSLFPPGRFPVPEDLSRWGIAQISASFRLAFTLAAPFLLVSFLYNLTLGVINRAMPQLMVAFIGAPAITFGALVLMLIVAPLILIAWVEALASFADNPFGSVP